MTRFARAAVLLIALASAACGGMKSVPPPPTLEEQVNAVKFRLFVLVEEQRHKLSTEVKPLALDPQLAAAAQLHSDEMARKNSFDEKNPDGNPAVNALLADPKFGGFVGENSAALYFTPGYRLDVDMVAKSFLDIWLHSPDHKSVLTNKNFDRTGIGVAVSGNTIYAAEVFATDLGLSPR
jgi:uncharacterized protein YkwD